MGKYWGIQYFDITYTTIMQNDGIFWLDRGGGAGEDRKKTTKRQFTDKQKENKE